MTAADLHTIYVSRRTANDSLYFERRASERYVCSGRATALVTGPDVGLSRNRILSLQLQDMSDTGLGALCQEQIEVGSQITVFIAPHGAERGFDLQGTVVRCQPQGVVQRVGIRFLKKMAA